MIDIYHEDRYDIPSGYHKCERIKHCRNMDRILEMQEKAVVIDGSGYFAALRVSSMFGCAAFENKET